MERADVLDARVIDKLSGTPINKPSRAGPRHFCFLGVQLCVATKAIEVRLLAAAGASVDAPADATFVLRKRKAAIIIKNRDSTTSVQLKMSNRDFSKTAGRNTYF